MPRCEESCTSPFDVFRSLTEKLNPVLRRRASWKNAMYAMIPRTEYAGYATDGNSVFTTERSEPPSDDEAWQRVTSIDDDGNPCTRSFVGTQVGFKTRPYKPEKYEMTGVLLCRNDLGLEWNTESFWNNYYTQMEHRGIKTLVNRDCNVLMHFSHKAACTGPADFAWVPYDQGVVPLGGALTPVPDLSGLPSPLAVDYCKLDLRMLQNGARRLITAGVTEPDQDNWITMGNNGPVFPLFIGDEALDELLTVNSELKYELGLATMGMGITGNVNPLLRAIGATVGLKNFRMVPTLYPPRWAWNAVNGFVRVSAFVMIDTAGNLASGAPSGAPVADRPTKGWAAVENPIWNSQDFGTGNGYTAQGVLVGAPFEGAVSPHPMVMNDAIMRPVNELRNAKWSAADWMGNWQFITGSEARSIGTGCYCSDPFGDYGIHVAQFWHALEPIHPEYGRLWVFRRCADEWECEKCS